VFSHIENLRHHCGVVGIHNANQDYIPEKLFYALFSLQHRGQESAGITYRDRHQLVVHKDLGSVATVLADRLQERTLSTVGIGHVRYSTRGGNTIENVQPVIAECNKGTIAVGHNGNISNATFLNDTLSHEGSIFRSTSDTELMLHLIARSRQTTFEAALVETLKKLEGAYSLVLIHEDTLYAVRDPYGFRPLYIGEKDGATFVASETCAFDILKVTNRREVKPGELLKIDSDGTTSRMFADPVKPHSCVFELIYFARPDSEVFGESVHLMRKKIGGALADRETRESDIVVPVPDSGNSAALGYAIRSGIPFELGLTRNHFTGRSFILPTTTERELAVRMKLHPVRPAIENKRVVLIDDSLVRGTTSRNLVKLVREAGAKEIHLRLAAPELKWPCFFGIDIPTRDELISNRMTADEIARSIGADSVAFLPLEDLRNCVGGGERYCDACFSGEYPISVDHLL
jgi:amidophosphoribosyltransferase